MAPAAFSQSCTLLWALLSVLNFDLFLCLDYGLLFNSLSHTDKLYQRCI